MQRERAGSSYISYSDSSYLSGVEMTDNFNFLLVALLYFLDFCTADHLLVIRKRSSMYSLQIIDWFNT